MIAEELINHMIPPLKVGDDAHKAIIWMEELRCNELPVVDNGRFLGLISEDVILEVNEIDITIGELDLFAQESVVSAYRHFYDVLKVASDNQVQLVAVINEVGEYQGVITVQDTVTAFAQSSAIQMPGSIIVLSMENRDYSLSTISRLIEENNAKILSSSVKDDELDPTKIKLTLKINQMDLSAIVATLERFEYKLIARFQESQIEDKEKGKIDMFLRYLDI